MNLVKGFNCSSSKITTLKYFLIIKFQIHFSKHTKIWGFWQSILTGKVHYSKVACPTWRTEYLYQVRAATVSFRFPTLLLLQFDSTGEGAAPAWVFRALAQAKAAAQWWPCSCTATCCLYFMYANCTPIKCTTFSRGVKKALFVSASAEGCNGNRAVQELKFISC